MQGPTAAVGVAVVTVSRAMMPEYLDMLSHCYAARQIALFAKVAPTSSSSSSNDIHSNSGGGSVCLVQIFAPAAVPSHTDPNPSGKAWPATVYLVDPVLAAAPTPGPGGACAAQGSADLLLRGLGPLLSGPSVPKVIFGASKVSNEGSW
jgi:hypothetical protein